MRLLMMAMMLGTLLAPMALAAPAQDATALLRRVYDNYRSASSQTKVSMTIHRPEWERRMELSTWTRGEDDALVRFTAPARDAGNASLKLGRQTWVFNPKLNQVIKLPASMMAQSWMGSDFSYNDLSRSDDIVQLYTSRIVGTDETGGRRVWTVEAVPKPGAPVVWGKVVIKVRDDYVILEQTFFDQDMKPARRMQTDRVAALGGRPYPVSMTMRPLDEPGRWTRVETQDAKFGVASPDYLFTLSNLQNPRR